MTSKNLIKLAPLIFIAAISCSKQHERLKEPASNDEGERISKPAFADIVSCSLAISNKDSRVSARRSYERGDKRFYSLYSFGESDSIYFPGLNSCQQGVQNNYPSIGGLNDAPRDRTLRGKLCRQAEYAYIVKYNQEMYKFDKANAVKKCGPDVTINLFALNASEK